MLNRTLDDISLPPCNCTRCLVRLGMTIIVAEKACDAYWPWDLQMPYGTIEAEVRR